MENIFDVIRTNNNTSSLMKCVRVTDLENKLNKPDFFYTVFAPSEIAFGRLHEVELEGWLKAENKTKLANILYNHIVEGQFKEDDLINKKRLRTVNGKILQVHNNEGNTWINGAIIKGQHGKASNGIVYLVDTIFLA